MKALGVKTLAMTALLATVAAPASADEAIKRLSGPLAVKGSFEFVARPGVEEGDEKDDVKDQRRAASGVACRKSDGRCLIVFDEGRAARWAKTFTQAAFEADPAAVLIESGAANRELDLEGVAAAPDGRLFLTGSHAPSRKLRKDIQPAEIYIDPDGGKCEKRPDAQSVYRIEGDTVEKSQRLAEALAGQTALKPSFEFCLQKGRGLDIEGVAFADERLNFGLRGPKSPDGKAYVLSVATPWLFGGEGDAAAQLKEVAVGDGRAIRDITSVAGGFLLLVGPDDDKANAKRPFAIMSWDGDTAREIGELSRFDQRDLKGCKDKKELEDRKPEGLAVMSETDTSWTVVVVSDGLCDGGPTWYEVTKP